jgi:hypothetical protein
LLDDAYQISFYLGIPHSNHPDAQVVDDQGSQFVMVDSVIMNLAVDSTTGWRSKQKKSATKNVFVPDHSTNSRYWR